jgi:hypothetical protein
MTYQNIRLEPRGPNFHFTWVSKWTWCLLQPKKCLYDPKCQTPVFFLVIQTGSCDLSKYSAWAKGSWFPLNLGLKMNLVSIATKKRPFWPKTLNTRIFTCHSNWVMWPIKLFGLSQGFLIFTLLGTQNELGVYRGQKTPFLTQNAKHSYFS